MASVCSLTRRLTRGSCRKAPERLGVFGQRIGKLRSFNAAYGAFSSSARLSAESSSSGTSTASLTTSVNTAATTAGP